MTKCPHLHKPKPSIHPLAHWIRVATTMATPLLFRGIPLLRSRLHHRLAVAVCLPTRRQWSTAPKPIRPDENLSSEKTTPSSAKPSHSPKIRRWEHPDYRKWKVKEKEILEDIEPIILLTKHIIHSHRSFLLSSTHFYLSLGSLCFFNLSLLNAKP